MILDTLDNAGRYAAMHPVFKRVFDFLRSPSLKNVGPGRLEIDGPRLFAIATQLPGKSPDEARLEAHRQYIDVHFLIAGKESIGWKGLADCREEEHPYDSERDYLSFSDDPSMWVTINPGTFAVFYPGDAHAPMVSNGIVQKMVLKVAL